MKLLVLITIFLIIIVFFYLSGRRHENHFYENTYEFKKRKITGGKPLFRLFAYCINLKDKKENMKFIKKEWKDYLKIERFVARKTCTLSHIAILCHIWRHRNSITFPIVIIEDDVFKQNNFVDYWNEILNIDNYDYVAFDAIFLKKHKIKSNHSMFVSLEKHNNTGFIVYYRQFFDKFKNKDQIKNLLKEPLDLTFTHNSEIKKLTPNKQVCRQIVSKVSSTSNTKSKKNHYNNYYKNAETYLKNL